MIDKTEQGWPRVDLLSELASEYREIEGVPADEGSRELPPDHKDRALSEIAKFEAGRDPEVVAFRQKVLGRKGFPVDVSRLRTWVEERVSAEAEQLAAFSLGLRDLVERHGAEVTSAIELRGHLTLEYLDLPDEWVRRTLVLPGGDLDRLRRLSLRLADTYGWTPYWAAAFVLAGGSPPLTQARVTQVIRSAPLATAPPLTPEQAEGLAPKELAKLSEKDRDELIARWATRGGDLPPRRKVALDRVVLDVSTRLSPAEVAQLYARARTEMVGRVRRDRPISDETLELAVFAAEHNTGAALRPSSALFTPGVCQLPRIPVWRCRCAVATPRRETFDPPGWLPFKFVRVKLTRRVAQPLLPRPSSTI